MKTSKSSRTNRLAKFTAWLPFGVVLALALIAAPGCGTSSTGALAEGDDFSGNGQPTAPRDEGLPAAAPSVDGEAAADATDLLRDIEEADIVKTVGDKLYALNQYKGLLIVDMSDPDAPNLLGSLDLRGRGVEMYVVGTQAYVVLSADFYYYALEGDAVPPSEPNAASSPGSSGASPGVALPPQPDFDGSRLAVIDVSDPTTPASKGKINLVGFASESRRVGNIIYVVGQNFIPYYFAADSSNNPQNGNQGFVASVSVADPDDVVAIERKTFPGDALNIHVSQTTLFAAGRDYDFNNGEALTNIQIIDISDPAGAITLRDAFSVPGGIRNRFYMDDYNDVFRIATESFGFGFAQVRLFTYDIADLDDVQLLGQTQIIDNESLQAVRFDGPRGYAVTFLQVDPLFVLDLSDPANPAVTGHLEVPGFSTHLEPRGNRLLAMGIDDTDGNRPAVAYYDVEDPANPTQLGRVILGPPGSFTESQAVYDEKAFKIVDALGLIAVPFNYTIYNGPTPGGPGQPIPMDDAVSSSDAIASDSKPDCKNGVQLVDFSDSALTQRGWFPQDGRVSRVGVIGDRLFSLSDLTLQTVDISNRDKPAKAGEAAFFGDNERAYYDNCSYYFPVDWQGRNVNDGLGLDQLFALLCGTTGVPAAGALSLGLCFLKFRSARRQRR